MARYTWLVMTQSLQLEIYPDELIIPYNCQFIFIQEPTPFSYELTEYYTINDKGFTNNLGVWDYRYGLETKNIPLYWRRLNLNRTTIKILDHELRSEVSKSSLRRHYSY